MRKETNAVTSTAIWLLRRAARRAAQTARLMIGVPNYEVYVRHRRTSHPEEAIMTYEEFFRDRQNVRYTVSKGRFKGCC